MIPTIKNKILATKYLTILFFFFLFSCDSARVFEQYKEFENRKWSAKNVVTFNFTIQDINQSYNIYYNVRNTLAYPYYNIYNTYELADQTGKIIESKMVENNLMHPQTGEPLGNAASGDLFDNQFPLLENYKFTKIGDYQLRIRQYMRMEELPEIVAVGIRVEKL